MKIKLTWQENIEFFRHAKIIKNITWKIQNIGYININLFLKGKNFYIDKYENTKLKKKETVLYFDKKFKAQTYIRGLRRNINKLYKNFDITEELNYSEEEENGKYD